MQIIINKVCLYDCVLFQTTWWCHVSPTPSLPTSQSVPTVGRSNSCPWVGSVTLEYTAQATTALSSQTWLPKTTRTAARTLRWDTIKVTIPLVPISMVIVVVFLPSGSLPEAVTIWLCNHVQEKSFTLQFIDLDQFKLYIFTRIKIFGHQTSAS